MSSACKESFTQNWKTQNELFSKMSKLLFPHIMTEHNNNNKKNIYVYSIHVYSNIYIIYIMFNKYILYISYHKYINNI